MKKINFYKADVEFNLKSKTQIRHLINKIFTEEQTPYKLIDYVFCSDEYLLNINCQYLKHDFFTDIITFQISDLNNPVHGEIYISVDRIKENAKNYMVPYQKELLRVIIHGVLHLCNYDDKNDAEQEQMRNKEEAYLQKFFNVSREN